MIQNLHEQVSALRAEVSNLKFSGEAPVGSQVPPGLFSPEEACQWLPYDDAECLRRAIRAGRFKSGTEVQKIGRHWSVNVQAIAKRLEREQTRRRVV
ncbi:MAG: hypothetical protein AAF329_08310 [Cyanobacteria bacterium P01_A01_bin.17]